MVWESPFPATVQDASFQLVDVNAAYLAFTGFPRERLIGLDPVLLQPAEDRAASVAARGQVGSAASPAALLPLMERRLIDADGRERWFRASRQPMRGKHGQTLWLVVLQDCTEEHIARERAERSLRELDDWFALSPVGMVLFDDSGLLLRSNAVFDALSGGAPVSLADAPESLRSLLAFGEGGPLPQLRSDGPPVRCHGWHTGVDGRACRLRATIRPYAAAGGRQRYMAVIEDRSAEEERDLAQVQIGAMMDTAGVGVATFAESSGWVRQSGAPAAAPAAAALQNIGRELVDAASLPQFEELQAALRHTRRADVRYAIHHPQLGLRWLHTRVEPATLASGKRTTSVVTLDVTEQQQSQQRNERLLHELTTILESTTAGIAYLRGDQLVRCNQRFESMLGLPSGSVAGMGIEQLFSGQARARRVAAETLQALAEGAQYETEFEVEAAPAGTRADDTTWYALSVRRTEAAGDVTEAIAVLSDITRLKAQQRELEALARDRELMFSLSGVGIAFIRGGCIQRANEAMQRLTGRADAALVNLPVAELFERDAPAGAVADEARRALAQQGRWTGERALRRSDGSSLWVQVSERLVRPEDPEGGVIAAYVDVDARRRAESALALQAERTRSVLDSVLVGIVTVGRDGIEWMNRSARRMFGGDLADFRGLPLATVATAEPDHPFRRTQYLDELAQGQAENFECRVKARDGREFWVVGNAVASGSAESGAQLTYALLDIERRRQAEAAVSQAQASLQRVIEAAPLAITLRDARTLKVLQTNQFAAESVETTAQHLVGCTPEQIFDAPTAAQRRADMELALASREVTQREYRAVTRGELRVWDARYLPLAAGPGEPPDQLLLVATEVTEQRAAQEARLEAAIAQRDMLVKEVHHRIKNNLQGVAGLMQQIGQRRPEMAQAMSEVIGQVQAIAQVYGLQVGAGGPLRLNSVVQAIAASVQRTFGRQIDFGFDGPAADAWALPEAESIPIALTINELLTNAVKHSGGAAVDAQAVRCRIAFATGGARVEIVNAGALPAGFSVARLPSGVSGLGLVRALLPRRSATLEVVQRDAEVVASVELRPPALVRIEPA